MNRQITAVVCCLICVSILSSCSAPADPKPVASESPVASDAPSPSPTPEPTPTDTNDTEWVISVQADGTLSIPFVDTTNTFNTFLLRLRDGLLPCSEISRVQIGDAVIELESVEGTSYLPHLYATSVTAFGQTITFASSELALYDSSGTFELQIFELDDCFVLSKIHFNGSGVTYIFTQQGVVTVKSPMDNAAEEYNCSVIRFSTDGKTLFYTRNPLKYDWQYPGEVFELCVSRDEFYCESGFVTIENGELIYHPTKTESIGEAKNLDSLYSWWLEYTNQGPYAPLLDEYLAQNALKYQRAY